MPVTKTQFGGIVTDIDMNLLPSGSCSDALNVTVHDGQLRRRKGFGVFDANVSGSASSVLNMFHVRFGDGDVYVVAKCANGSLYYRQSTASSFTGITTRQTHSGYDRGWGFVWADRFHYFDRGNAILIGGGSRWNPDVNLGVAYRAGLPKPTSYPKPSQSATTWLSDVSGGEKNGYYHVVTRYLNRTTGETGVFSESHTPPVWCLTSDSGGNNWGRISLSDWKNSSDMANYEFGHVETGCTMGGTEFIPDARLGASGNYGRECFSYQYFADSIQPTTASSLGLYKADHIKRKEHLFDNAGGEPPGSLVGCYDGSQAFYGGVYYMLPSAGTPTVYTKTYRPEVILYSIPGFPTMVPQDQDYYTGNDSYRFRPQPWKGELVCGLGGITAMASGGGVTVAFTAHSTHLLRSTPTGQISAIEVHGAKGAAGAAAAVGTNHGVYSIGTGCFMRISKDGVVDIAKDRFADVIEEIPAAMISSSVMGYYAFTNQVWAAVAKSGSSYVQRILVWDVDSSKLTVFEPTCLAATESIVSMVEYCPPGEEPIMLVGTSAGRILKYPYGDTDNGTGYAASWTGWFGQERLHKSQTVSSIEVHTGSNVGGSVTWRTETQRTATQSVTSKSGTFVTSVDNDRLVTVLTDVDRIKGRVFGLKFSSDASSTSEWNIRQVVFIAD